MWSSGWPTRPQRMHTERSSSTSGSALLYACQAQPPLRRPCASPPPRPMAAALTAQAAAPISWRNRTDVPFGTPSGVSKALNSLEQASNIVLARSRRSLSTMHHVGRDCATAWRCWLRLSARSLSRGAPAHHKTPRPRTNGFNSPRGSLRRSSWLLLPLGISVRTGFVMRMCQACNEHPHVGEASHTHTPLLSERCDLMCHWRRDHQCARGAKRRGLLRSACIAPLGPRASHGRLSSTEAAGALSCQQTWLALQNMAALLSEGPRRGPWRWDRAQHRLGAQLTKSIDRARSGWPP